MSRRLGLQEKWKHVIDSLEGIVPSYEKASSRISLFTDREMRRETAAFSAAGGGLVLDLGAGPGTMAREVAAHGAEPVLLDVSSTMLKSSAFPLKVRGCFENLPFRTGAFDGAVSGFAIRDSLDLRSALEEVSRVVRSEGKFSFCDLGKPDSKVSEMVIALYLRTGPTLIGLVTSGRSGLGYGSLFDTYLLTPKNSELKRELEVFFAKVSIHERQRGASIVVRCSRAS